jgi:FtsH-binding integral membrane protein
MMNNDSNPYAMNQAVPAAQAAVAERAAFLQRTYTWLLMGILGFCATMWSVETVPFMQQLSFSIASNPLIAIVLMIGGAWAVHAVAERAPINAFAFAAYVVLFGLLIGPWVMIAGSQGGSIVTQAAMITSVIFLGLTIYVFISGKDFSFLGGVLSIVLFAMLAIALCAWLFGLNVGVWFSILGAMLFSGYILYDTSRILLHYPTTAHVAAAAVLFVDVVLLFKYILMMLMNRD